MGHRRLRMTIMALVSVSAILAQGVPVYARSECYKYYGKDRESCFKAERAGEKAREALEKTKEKTREALQKTRKWAERTTKGFKEGWKKKQ